LIVVAARLLGHLCDLPQSHGHSRFQGIADFFQAAMKAPYFDPI